MLGDFLSRCLVVVFAYAYPAFECYKTVEKNKVEIEQLRFWCQYWIIIALLTVFERFAEIFISWLPMYGEIKLGFIIYLWYPNIKGTAYVYQTFVQPYIGKYEKDIDRSILELRTRARDLATLHLQNCVHYAQTAFFQILQYLAAQSANVRNMKSQNNSNGPTNQQQQPDKRQTSSVNRSVSSAPKTELVQEHLPSEKLEQRVECTTTTTNTTNDTNKKEDSTNAKASDAAETPQSARAASNKEESASDVAEALRVARGKLRQSPSNIPNNETKKEN